MMGLSWGFSPTHIFNFFVGKYLGFCGLHSRLVELDNGTTMECWAPKHHDGTTPPKPSLVLLHAFGLNSYTWCRQVSSFATSFHVLIPNLLFSGRSHTSNPDRTELFQVWKHFFGACLSVFFIFFIFLFFIIK
jgi:pimeloyl-ACP methyl ester carboxylesterase